MMWIHKDETNLNSFSQIRILAHYNEVKASAKSPWLQFSLFLSNIPKGTISINAHQVRIDLENNSMKFILTLPLRVYSFEELFPNFDCNANGHGKYGRLLAHAIGLFRGCEKMLKS